MKEVDKDSHLYKLRHSLAHILAQAVLKMRPDAKLAFGPPVSDGCYYDFLFSEPITPEMFPEIEKNMRRIISEAQEFSHRVLPLDEAIEKLKTEAQDFKVEYCEELGKQGERAIGFFKNGPFEDMCAGPHLVKTSDIPPDCFKVQSIAGAYWRGDEVRPQLTRIYCVAFENKLSLKEYLDKLELAKERDHRKLGKELELFIISDEVGAGLPLWLPNGNVLRDELEKLGKEVEQRHGYVRVSTPHIAKDSLYYTSGHLPYYSDGMFPPMELEGESKYYLKAMNCPHHHMVYSHRPRSYRELPLKIAEYGTCYRYEPSGTLSGLLRVRSLSMNDAHIYCTLDQLRTQIKETFDLTLEYFNRFRFKGVKIRFSTHDPENKSKYVDNPELWKFSENVVEEVIKSMGVEYVEGPGEAAFYGPKIDFQATTLLGREESISTTQLDFASPINFDLLYTAEDGKEHRPYIIHRAPLGTHERFLAFLIEHFGGAFPTWMSPVQARIIPVNEQCEEAAHALVDTLKGHLLRADVDTSSHSFNKKIRLATTSKIPNVVVLGPREVENKSVTLRRYCVKEQATLSNEQFIDRMLKLNRERIMDNFADVKVE